MGGATAREFQAHQLTLTGLETAAPVDPAGEQLVSLDRT